MYTWSTLMKAMTRKFVWQLYFISYSSIWLYAFFTTSLPLNYHSCLHTFPHHYHHNSLHNCQKYCWAPQVALQARRKQLMWWLADARVASAFPFTSILHRLLLVLFYFVIFRRWNWCGKWFRLTSVDDYIISYIVFSLLFLVTSRMYFVPSAESF